MEIRNRNERIVHSGKCTHTPVATAIGHSCASKDEAVFHARRTVERTGGDLARCSNAWHAIRIRPAHGMEINRRNRYCLSLIPLIQYILQNIRKAIKLSVAEAIDFANVTTAEIKSKLIQLLQDPKYATKSKRLSQICRDQKETPLERAVWWIEWVLRNPHPEFLASPTLQLGHIVSSAFDVIACVVAMTILTVFVGAKGLLGALKAIRSTKQSTAHTQMRSKSLNSKKSF